MSDKKKSPDQQLDGPKIAASILSRMKSSDQKRLIENMRESAPEVTSKVEANLVTFEQIGELTSQSVQLLLKEIDQRDLALSLSQTDQALASTILANMSDRKKASIKEDCENLRDIKPAEIEEAKLRIVKRLEALRSAGKIRTQSEHDIWV